MHTPYAPATELIRVRVRVRGTVQGVGFRPHCARAAQRFRVTGWVRNDADGVLMELQGEGGTVDACLHAVLDHPPPLAHIAAHERTRCPLQTNETAFAVRASTGGQVHTGLPPDAAVCAACLDELFDPTDRRHGYALINCTECGPRYTLTRHLPYDRAQTSMAGYPLCEACAREYADPANRRFHAEPMACPRCGPGLELLDARGQRTHTAAAAIATAAQRLRAGAVLAVKGIGGFHLVCDALDGRAVERLRVDKSRGEKPFAVMALNLASLAVWANVPAAAATALREVARPIVLLEKRTVARDVLHAVAPHLAEIGVMLPYTPVHWLLFHALLGHPAGRGWREQACPRLLVMTSANRGGEPLLIDETQAVQRLGGVADGFLSHARAIVARCDDSLLRVGDAANPPQLLRRARGFVPVPIALPGVAATAPSVLACGAWLKNTVCVTRGAEAFLSPHLGDLSNPASCAAFDEAVDRLCDLLDVRPACLVHDLHPDFYSTTYALARARRDNLPALAVQHHHAHIAAVLAEHGVADAVLGLALDGVGLGNDGAAWGGELLRVARNGYRRIAHWRPLPLPGGDRATREPWRTAAAALHLLGRGGEIAARFPMPAAPTVAQMLARGVQCPPTTSAGRWFDAAAALLGIGLIDVYEAEAAMCLEALAHTHGASVPPHNALPTSGGGLFDPLPLLARLANTTPEHAAAAAAWFHDALADSVAAWTLAHAQQQGIRKIVLAGGCMLNRLLRRRLRERLLAAGCTVLEPRLAPPSDGGIALGQAWVALQAHV
ncbi:MAG: carbamoyltransferase HypF [Rhodanobacter sp.]|jgi:hydrogenase maturation protein HypF|nr:carbamoyltransferase HypF [Rhodanobacter sp.]